MDTHITVRLPAELARALDARVRRMGERRSDVVRSALREYLGAARSRAKPIDRVRQLIGSVDGGPGDLAERHRAYVLESLRRGR
jgi:metal-responsive CopG/Arc/MetJ family transcriptional regulator